MYFGEFLLSKKVINEDQLLEALIFQVEQLPSFLRVLREEQIISSSEIVRMIQLQLENNGDLISVLRDENKIDEKRLNRLFQKQVANRKMLGSVLVELNFVEQPVIEKILHEFLRDKGNLQKIQNPEQVESIKEKIAEPEISDAALESLRELGLSDEAFTPSLPAIEGNDSNIFVDEFLNVFNVKMNNKLRKLIEILNQSAKDESDISNYFNSLYRDIFVLKGAALLGELNLSANLLDEWGKLVEEKLMLKNNAQLKKWCLAALPILEESITYLWEVREVIFRDKDEKNIRNTPSLYENSLKILVGLKSIK